MKKILLFTVCLSSILASSAQNSSPYWSLSGNSNATSTSKLGTTNAVNLGLFTNNLERMRIATTGNVGIGTINPTDKLHINSASGTNPFRAQVNGSSKLVVNSNGGVSVGTGIVPPSNGLYVSGNVGIGTNTPSYKLHVVNASTAIYGNSTSGGFGVYGNSTYIGVYGTGSSYGLYGYTGSTSSGTGVFGSGHYGLYGSGGAYGVYGSGTSYGVYGYSDGGNGIYGVSKNATAIFGSGFFGVYGSGTNTGVYGSGSTYGVYGFSSAGNGIYGYSSSAAAVYGQSYSNIGGYFTSTSSDGIWAQTASSASNVYAGVFQGNVYTYNAYITSDKNLKKNIQEFDDAMGIINKLKPKNYEFRNDGKYQSLQLPKGNHYGLLAQDLEQVLPGLVKDAPLMIIKNLNNDDRKQPVGPTVSALAASIATADIVSTPATNQATTEQQQEAPEIINTKGVNYIELIPLMIKGMQELSRDNEKLRNEVDQLKTQVQTLTNGGSGVSLHSSAFIKQNAPNPANNNTVIGYFIPNDVSNAQIVISDIDGIVLRSYTVQRGQGQLNIIRGELAAGTYNYTLFVNGIKADTKQLIIIK